MAETNRIAVIRALFGCAEDTADEISRSAIWRSNKAGEPVLHQGSDHGACNMVVSGSADLKLLGQDGRYSQIATIEVGEPFGVYPAADVMTTDVVARRDLEHISIDAGVLARIAEVRADLGAALARLFAKQLQALLGRFAARLTLSATGRVYEQLLLEMDEDRRIAPVPVVAALAVQAQTTRETASRAVSALERRGIIERHPDHWRVTSPRMLEEMLV
ncbi:Crp/Fnr family transcriptional regulator [Aurantiacibacter sp. MUD11]|uniref:Crp/Fnr family transcriptional regulator n=1 Tax=Aurantiacibacter sp. MUD11 TaxID=3003265 RepID=UPI0022AB2C38|nr:Crp/Fnr family transcriptional regulator [Aurantiacibacter sp. MUD11]WAT18691.1 Crp/Fnr family transcriptional regulator [Aurantiacibacter sp. MUD11]